MNQQPMNQPMGNGLANFQQNVGNCEMNPSQISQLPPPIVDTNLSNKSADDSNIHPADLPKRS